MFASVAIGLIPIAILIFDAYGEMSIISKVNYSLLGLFFIVVGITDRKSVIFDKLENFIIEFSDSNFKIHPSDKELTFSEFQIVLTKENGEKKLINELVLNFSDAKRLAKWLNSEFKNSDLIYNWKTENNIKLIKTNTDNM